MERYQGLTQDGGGEGKKFHCNAKVCQFDGQIDLEVLKNLFKRSLVKYGRIILNVNKNRGEFVFDSLWYV